MEVQPSPKEGESESESGVFGDPLVARTAREDPLFVFLKNSWRQVAVVVAAVVLGYFARETFRQNYEDSMRRAGELYSNLRREWQAVEQLRSDFVTAREESIKIGQDPKAPQADKESALKKVSDLEEKIGKSRNQIKELLLALSDSREPYASLARSYQAIDAARNGDFNAAKAGLAAAKWSTLAADSSERYFAELAAFGYAGALLDAAETSGQAVAALQALAKAGTYLNSASAIRLARLARTPEERSAALATLQAVISVRGEDSALLAPEIKRLGGK